MSKLSATSNTIKKLGITGIGIDSIEHQLFLFQQFEPKIVLHKIVEGALDPGKYYVEGDITEYLAGYDYFWVNNREVDDSNIFQVNSYSYDSTYLWTEMEITYVSTYKTKISDIGAQICGRMDITGYLKNLGDNEINLMEDGSISNALASTLNFTLNDEDQIFYNRNSKTGYFYQKDVLTEVNSVQGESNYHPRSNIFSTFINVKSIPKYWTGVDFINGHAEFITGDGTGSKSVINAANGYSLKLLDHYAPNYIAENKFHPEVKAGDSVRLYKSEIFWFKLDIWHREEISEKIATAFGKLDLSNITVNDKERTVAVNGFNTIRDLYNKDIRNLTFDGGTNLSRLKEVRPLYIDKPQRGDFKPIKREEISENPLNSVTIKQVGFDVSEGWHILDFHPYGNMFRFDLGRWFSVIDEGSFEKSTGQIFLVSYDKPDYNNPAKIPAHDGQWLGEFVDFTNTPPGSPPSYNDKFAIGTAPTGLWASKPNYIAIYTPSGWYFQKPMFGDRAYDATGTQSIMFDGEEWSTDIDAVNNILVERNWHGKWCAIEIATEEVINLGSTGGQYLGGENYQFKKLKGLPTAPARILFYINDNRLIEKQTSFLYSYDDGGLFSPHILFDYIEEWNQEGDEFFRDVTYPVGMGGALDRKSTTEPPLDFETSDDIDLKSLRCYHHKPFNGLIINFDNKGFDTLMPDTYDTFAHALFSNMQLKFTQGGRTFSTNMNLRYTGGEVLTVVDTRNFTLEITYLSNSWDDNYNKIEGMRILCTSGDNFLEVRKINTVVQDTTYLNRLVLNLETALTNTPATTDTFVILNKNFNVKIFDIGQSFKDGYKPDVAAYRRIRTDKYVDFINQDSLSIEGLSGQMQPLDELYIGYRSKFDSVFLVFDQYATPGIVDYANTSWFLRDVDLVVEYWDGYNWKTARDVMITPTTLSPIKDGATPDEFDDFIKYKVSFEADDWFTGGYDHTQWTSVVLTDAPSPTDEDEIYLVRVRLLTSLAPNIKRLGLGRNDDLNLCLLWEDFESWAPNSVTQYENKVLADSLTIGDVDLPLFGVDVYWHNQETLASLSDTTGMIRMARPVTRLDGALEDNLYIGIDYNSISLRDDTDAIVSNEDRVQGFSYLPKNINLLYMMDNILKSGNFDQNKRFLSFRDSYNKSDRDIVSVVGSDYDGVYPFEAGWDAALVNENFSDYMTGLPTDFIDVCIRRVDGEYYLWGVNPDQQSVELWKSPDLKTWTLDTADIIQNVASDLILALEVVKNKDDDNFLFIPTYRTWSGGIYRVYAQEESSADSFDISTSNAIISAAPTDHLGKVTAVQLEGQASDTSNCARLIWVERFSGTGTDGNGIPTGTPSIELYSNADSDVTVIGNWTYRDSKAGYRRPLFVKANYSCTTNAPFNSACNRLNTAFIIAQDNSTTRMVRFSIDTNIISAWSSAIDITSAAFTLLGITNVCDGVVYNLRNQTGETAFSLVPTFSDVSIIVGIDGSGNVTPIALNEDINDWDATGFYKNQLIEHNNWDWFRSYYNDITFNRIDGDQTNRTKLFLGFRKPFNKIDCIPQNVSYFNKLLQIRYWDGSEWVLMPYIWQNNLIRYDGKFHSNYGFVFEKPLDWKADIFTEVSSTDINIRQNFNSLFWVEISLGDDAANDDEISMKSFSNAFTCLFLTKGRNLYYMEDWDYVKNIYTYPYDTDKNIKIDSIAPDYEDKLVVVNYTEDNPYEYKVAESLVFDFFGKFKTSYPLWLNKTNEGVNQYTVIKDTPENIYRTGVEEEATIETPSTSALFHGIGSWTEDFIENIYDGSMSPAIDTFGWNIPIPSEQFIRKYTLRGEPWIEPGETHWRGDVLNNILLGRRGDLVDNPDDTYLFNNTVQYLLGSLTNCGLLHEELINAPYVKLTPGMYAALEKSFLKRSQQYDILVLNTISILSLPGSPNVGDTYILNDGNEIFSLIYWNGATWGARIPEPGAIVYNQTANEYWIFTGTGWKDLDSDVVWPGRETSNSDYGIGLDWTLGQEGIKMPYFRPYNVRPEIWKNNNVLAQFDYKVSTVFRHINFTLDSLYVIGHDLYDSSSPINKNFKPTCSVLMPDLSAIKDSVQDSDAKHIMEASAPGCAFGAFQFGEPSWLEGSIPDRYDSGTDEITPMGYSGIGLYKPYGKVRKWKQCWFYDYLTTTYSDITDNMNYRMNTPHTLDPSGSYIYLCMDYRFFGFCWNKEDDYDREIWVEYYDVNSGWLQLNILEDDEITDLMGTEINQDTWNRKTVGYNAIWEPFNKEWFKTTINGIEGYWIRISYPVGGSNEHSINWISCTGMWVWDNLRWWEEHLDVISNTMPTSSFTQEDYRFFDSWVPISIEYDVVRNRITGCFWDFSVGSNKYYPFIIQFYRDVVKGGNYDTWSWELELMEIVDGEDFDYSYKIQSICNISPIDNKALLVQESKADSTPIIANIKNFHNGDFLFSQDIQ